jgi:hypothetical protein
MRAIFRLSAAILLALLTLRITGSVSAQSAARPDVAVLTYEQSPSTRIRLDSYAPGSASPKGLHVFDKGPVVDISPDFQWSVAYGFDPQAKHDALRYGPLKGPPMQLPVDNGHSVLGAKFSANSHFLSYTTASPATQDWVLGLVRLDGGQRIEFTGKFSAQGNAAPFDGVANALGWSADGQRLFVIAYRPFTEGGAFGGIYALDLSRANFDKPERRPLPALTPLVGGGPLVTQVLISPDASRLAYLFNDPANPPQDYDSGPGYGVTVNTLGLYDLNASKALFTAQAGKGQAFETMTWTPDSQRILLTAGNYRQTNYLVTPTLIIVDVGQMQVGQGPQVTTDPKAMVGSMLACGTTLYYQLSFDENGALTPYLYSASLADLKQHSDRLTSGADFRLLTCAP